MSSKRSWVISDTHFGHQLMVKGFEADGSKIRPWHDVEAMDEELVSNWNELIAPSDRVYHLGDVAINRRHLATISRCHGKKVLIKGNHDIFKLADYVAHFEDIRAYRVYTEHDVILSHIPLHPHNLTRFKRNIHGHLHRQIVRDAQGVPDPRYTCVCVEQTNYRPVLLDQLLAA